MHKFKLHYIICCINKFESEMWTYESYVVICISDNWNMKTKISEQYEVSGMKHPFYLMQ